MSSKEYYQKHKEEIKQRTKDWNQKNPDKLAINQARYYQKHKETINAKRKSPRNSFHFYQDFLKPLLALVNIINSPMLEKLCQSNLPSQQFIILSLWKHEPSLTQTDIAAKLKLSQPQLSRIINNKLYYNVKSIITNYKTKNKELLSLILKVTIQK